MEATTRPAPRRLPTELRQEEIVRVALDLAAKHGAKGTTIQSIATTMNLTQGAIFRHFPTKDAIWLALIDWLRAQLGEVIARVEAEHADPLARIAALFRAHAGFIGEHVAIPRLVFAELSQSDDPQIRSAIHAVLNGYEGRLVALLAEGKHRGRFRADMDEQAGAALFLAALQGLALQHAVLGQARTVPEYAEKFLPLLLAAIGAGPAAGEAVEPRTTP